MPVNNGREPPHPLVDIKLRNGTIVRNTEPKLWRWKRWPDGESLGDIVSWQVAGALSKWVAGEAAKSQGDKPS